jgi:FkbM family methyltransferase
MKGSMSEIPLRMTDGTQIVVPASLEAITTYVILEQEKWFEKEITFLSNWLKPGMTVLDIGANLGVYSLPITRLVGPNGQVFAYEPGSEARRLLTMSKTLNGFENLHVIDAALSDSEREGHLVPGASSELSSLEGSGPGERVRITSLDAEQTSKAWGDIDFIKIDAEGEEERIIQGAKRFLTGRSPLIMFEVKAGAKINDRLPATFAAVGFGTYRLLNGAPVLVPVAIGEPLDPYELNLFAAKPDRAAALAHDGFLVEALTNWTPSDAMRADALAFLKAQRFAPIFAALPGGGSALDPDYRDALAGYAAWRSTELPLSERYAALRFACDQLTLLCQREATLSRASTLARMAWEIGRRRLSVQALRIAADVLKRGDGGRIMEPFWPANPRFDAIAPGANVAEWFVVAVLEQLEVTSSYSSLFGTSGVDLDWLVKQPFVSAEIERRRILLRSRAGQKTPVPPRLLAPATDHINADAWRTGLVPNASLR